MHKKEILLGSLFDGIGAVPYAASFFGIKTLWASEILPNAVSVTKHHFPEMEHLGDITKLNGGEIPSVQVIAFGSPCQSFSVAGDRKSFEGKSVLFFEAIRIIREMRCATHGKFPEIALFENVPGLLNVDSRRSYKTVLEAFCETEIPMPESGRWANAGMVRGRGTDLAWVIKDAQYHRTAQRRKRLFVVVDFTGERASKILFVSKSLSGYFAAREREREGITAAAENGIGNTGGRIGAFMAGQAKNARSIAYSETVSPTLKGSPSGLNQIPCICELTENHTIATFSRQRSDSFKQDDLASTQTARQYKDATDLVCRNVAAVDCRNLTENNEISGTLQSKCTGGYSLSYQNPVRTGNTIRRLTPVESERLMSLPDSWTEYGHDGKMMSDSARYQMCGNSIVVNCLAYIMQNIADALN